MKIQYFQDTDTLYSELSQNPVEEMKDINENMLVDLDREGRVCAITLENAKSQTELTAFSFETVTQEVLLSH